MGSVGDVPFTVSGVREPEGDRPGSGPAGRHPVSPAHTSPGVEGVGCEVLVGPTCSFSLQPNEGGRGRGVVGSAAVVGNYPSRERIGSPSLCPPTANGAPGVTRREGSSPRVAPALREEEDCNR